MVNEGVRIRTNEEIASEIQDKPDLYQFYEELKELEKNPEAKGSNRPDVQRWNICYLLDHYHDKE